MKSLILTLLVGTIFLVLPFVGKAIQGDDSLKLYLPSEGEKGKVVKDKSENGNDEKALDIILEGWDMVDEKQTCLSFHTNEEYI